MQTLWSAVAAGGLLVLVGCGVGEGTGSTPPWADPETPTAPPSPVVDENPPEPIDPFRVRMQTTKGDIVIDVHPEWAPRGAQRFKDLVEAGFYDDNRIFRVVPTFVAQFGMNGDPEVQSQWDQQRIPDDPVTQSNRRGYVTFATAGANSRTTQIFINLKDNPDLDSMTGNFAPFAEVVEGMDVVDSFNNEYGNPPEGQQERIRAEGNAYLDREYPRLDSIVKATVIEPDADEQPSETDAPDENDETTEAAESE